MTRNGKIKAVPRNIKLWQAVARRQKAKAMAAAPNDSRKLRYSTDVYAQEFIKYLKKLQDSDQRNEIVRDLKAKGIHEQLRTLSSKYEYVINEDLVKLLINEPNLEYNWRTIEEAILKAEHQILKECRGIKEEKKHFIV
ncbi:hypothetical protein AVEN_148266-1 [Araneus ventricosus]|uniref:Uncharacterized protein n=1 Tax=Araneus ventricosus TaxID=182803 RepID=A0A4Y2HK32_ARAVE|nr:hypothetical protein AVEN_148266-1 [Araneus ventricosus]